MDAGFLLFFTLALAWAYITFSLTNSPEWGSVFGGVFYFTAVLWASSVHDGLRAIMGYPLITLGFVKITPALLWGLFVSSYISMSWQPKLSRGVMPVLFLAVVITYLITRYYFTR